LSVVVTSLLLSACVGGPPPVDEDSEAATTAFANDKPAFEFFVGKGLTNFQSAGIVGNLDQESGVNPGSVQSGGPGRGIAQWSVGGRWDTSANDNVLAYASKQGESSGSLNLQLEFIWYELTTIGYGYTNLKATTNVTDATVVFMDKYEICGTCDQTNRVNYAKAVLAAYGVTPDWSATFVSQSWPYASAPAFQVKCGGSVAAKITLKNSGAKAWNSSTRLGTTEARDRASIFAGSDWIATNRAATSGAVAPGNNGTFAFSFHGPTGADCKPGTYKEYFGVVQDGVAWFSDSGQGGPPDNQLEALIDLVPGDPTPAGADMGDSGGGGSGGGPGDGVDGGTIYYGDLGDNGGGAADNPESGGSGGNGVDPAQHGCSMSGSTTGDGVLLWLVVAGVALTAGRRRRSRA
jgi:hypothetical protein